MPKPSILLGQWLIIRINLNKGSKKISLSTRFIGLQNRTMVNNNSVLELLLTESTKPKAATTSFSLARSSTSVGRSLENSYEVESLNELRDSKITRKIINNNNLQINSKSTGNQHKENSTNLISNINHTLWGNNKISNKLVDLGIFFFFFFRFSRQGRGFRHIIL